MDKAIVVRKTPVPAKPPIASVELAPLTAVQASKLFSLLGVIADTDLDQLYFSMIDDIEDIRNQEGQFEVVRPNEEDEVDIVFGNNLTFRKRGIND